MHRRTDTLHAFQRVTHGTVSLLRGIECAARRFSAGFRVVGYLLHRNGELFYSRRSIRDFLVLLDSARGHFFRRDQNFVGVALDVDRALAHALQHFAEVIEHVVDGVHYVAERVVGHAATQGHVTTRDLADDGQELGNTLL